MKLILKRIKELIFFSKQIKDSISIPNYISKIGYSAFKNCKTLKNIKIPESVKEIGKFAFDGCSSLETLLFSSHLEKIGRCAFSNCYSIKNIVIPESVIEIGYHAFYQCLSIQNSDKITNLYENKFLPDNFGKEKNNFNDLTLSFKIKANI